MTELELSHSSQRRVKRLALVLGTLVLSLSACFWLWVRFGAELFHSYHVSETLVKRVSYLELDSELGWRGKAHFDQDWPREEGTPEVWVRRYKLDEQGFRDHIYSESDVDRASLNYKICLLGDSSPFGFGCEGEQTLGARLRRDQLGQGVGVYLWCVTGYNANQLLKLWRQKSPQNNLEILVLWAGFNDVEFTKAMFFTAGVSKTVAFQRYKLAVTEILELEIPTLLVTLPHLEPSPDLDRLNAWIRKQNKYPHVSIVDLESEFARSGNAELFAPIDDRLPMHFHPSEKGHELAYKVLKPLIEERL